MKKYSPSQQKIVRRLGGLSFDIIGERKSAVLTRCPRCWSFAYSEQPHCGFCKWPKK